MALDCRFYGAFVYPVKCVQLNKLFCHVMGWRCQDSPKKQQSIITMICGQNTAEGRRSLLGLLSLLEQLIHHGQWLLISIASEPKMKGS